MPVGHCPICLSDLPIDEFVIFPCGHGFCIDCKSYMFKESERPDCPNCRRRLHDQDSHLLFLELVDAEVAFASNIVEGLNKMDHETPLLRVEKAGEKLTEVLKDPRSKSNDMTALIKAAEDFNDRIVPLFSIIEVQQHEINTLREDSLEIRQDTQVLWDQLTKAGIESSQRENELNKAKKNEKEAIRKARESELQWQMRTAELVAENQRYKDMLDEYNESARLQREQKEQSEKRNKLQKQGRHKVAAKGKEPMSDAAGEHDGDFSAHEHSMIRNSLNVMSNFIGLDMESIPFLSNWKVNKSDHEAKGSPNPRSTNTRRRLTKSVQSRPQSIIHITR